MYKLFLTLELENEKTGKILTARTYEEMINLSNTHLQGLVEEMVDIVRKNGVKTEAERLIAQDRNG